ncbi:MAG: M20/M25/M40 family metallo-hydrolase [Brevundimonas sp.]|uniref:M20/M25/M40 family metallo-hydrolase n=1 Tax=Brevundimonas sp. TaxID=1871086 RepID=UPI00403359F4
MTMQPEQSRSPGRLWPVVLFVGALTLALVLGVLALQVPTPRGLGADPARFSAARAMTDVRAIARAPHPIGSAEHQRVQDVLFARMAALGLNPERQTGLLSPEAMRRMERWGLDPSSPLTNLVGVLPASGPGADPRASAVLLMAHYDTTPKSPGAADDSAGVAAVLETVRAIRARGPIRRPLVVLLTDGEELNLDGARAFFSEHPWRERLGAVVNLEARGGGGRAMMFETGPGNRQTIDLFADASARAPGGPTSNSLAVVVYENMPNGTDFTLARERGLAGLNFAFIGRPDQYHAANATPDNLDQGALQHLGGQALEAVDALVRTPVLPVAGERRVYADLMGRTIVSHAPATGWWIFGLAVALTAFGYWGARHATKLKFTEVARGAADGLWLIATGLVLTKAVRLLGGPLSSRADSPEAYYTLLRRLPWLEGGAVLVVLAVALALLAGRQIFGRITLSAVTALAALFALILGGIDYAVVGGAVISLLLIWTVRGPRSTRGGWIGLIALTALLGGAVQTLSPEAAFLLLWPALLASTALALSILISARMQGPVALIPPAVATVLGGGWIVYLAHPVFLGVGMDMPGVLAPLALLALVFAYPLGRTIPAPRILAACAVAALIAGAGITAWAQAAEPSPPAAAP